MANSGVPQGGNYPSRQELASLLKPFLQDSTGAKAAADKLNVDRRYLYGKQVNRLFQDQLNTGDVKDDMMGAGAYFRPQSYSEAQTANAEQIEAGGGATPAFIEWEVPTSSTNYQRPRTVAAGYDEDRGTMTVVFRDGTFYNYYEVTPTEWESFHASYSKGRPWLNRKNSNQASDGIFIGKPRGDAGDMSDINPQIREALYRVARAQQIKTRPKMGRTSQKPGYKNAQGAMVPIPNKLKKDISAKRGGTNPAINAGKAPRRKAS